MWKWLAILDKVERRVIYGVLLVCCAIPFFVDLRLPLKPWKETQAAFDITDSCPKNKVVAICSNWVSGSQGENWPQYQAIVSHCMLRHIKFIVFCMDPDPAAPQFAEHVNQIEAKKYGRAYGVDWVNLGIARGAPLTMGAIGRNIKNVFTRDQHEYATNNPVKLPILQGINSTRDIHILWCVDYQPDANWMVWFDPTGRTPIAFASAGIVTGSWYPFLASGQMKGMMAGLRGAAEYEDLLKEKYGARYKQEGLRGNRLLVPLAFGHLVIIVFVVLGNIGMVMKRRAARGSA
jgi:hypothetical protein